MTRRGRASSLLLTATTAALGSSAFSGGIAFAFQTHLHASFSPSSSPSSPAVVAGREAVSRAAAGRTGGRWVGGASATRQQSSSLLMAAAAAKGDGAFPVAKDLDPKDTGLKVTPTSWKWPPTWPYTDDYFDRENEEEDAKFYEQARPREEGAVFPPEAVALLNTHYERFIPEGAHVLDIGASYESYLPQGLLVPGGEVTGVGMNAEEMAANAVLKNKVTLDLNAREDGEGLSAAAVRLPFEDNTFDACVVTNSIEFFINPRNVMREAYRVLKPSGVAMVVFTNAGAYEQFKSKQASMWQTMNDAQHMWVVGSYFKFSAGDGWDELKGYDLSLEEGKSGVFVVQATKTRPPDESDVLNSMRNKMLSTAQFMNTEDVDFVANRLATEYETAETDEGRKRASDAVRNADQVYKCIMGLPATVLSPQFRAMLACRLALDWSGSEAQQNGLKEGLGLMDPSPELWKPLGEATLNMDPEDKVILLSDVVRAIGLGGECVDAVMDIKDLFPKVAAVLRAKNPTWPDANVELMTVDLMTTDYFEQPKEKRDSFVQWLEGVEPLQYEQWLFARQSYKLKAEALEQAEELKREEEEKKGGGKKEKK